MNASSYSKQLLLLSCVICFTLLQLSVLFLYLYPDDYEDSMELYALHQHSLKEDFMSSLPAVKDDGVELTVVRRSSSNNNNDMAVTRVFPQRQPRQERVRNEAVVPRIVHDDTVSRRKVFVRNEYRTPPSQPANSNSNNKLEFVHITKTGGSAIERAAGLANITWGTCHFHAEPGVCSSTSVGDVAPSLKRLDAKYAQYKKLELWHTPYYWFQDYGIYKDRDTFVVVRNPYERILSEFYCKYYGYNRMAHAQARKRNQDGNNNVNRLGGTTTKRKKEKQRFVSKRVRKDHGGRAGQERRKLVGLQRRTSNGRMQLFKPETANSLNGWIQQQLQRGFNYKTAHMLPQHLYVYHSGNDDDDSGKQQQEVTHVLRYESLHDEFQALMKQYNLPITLPRKQSDYINAGATTAQTKLIVKDLLPETIRLINEFYKDDFRLLGYKMIQV